MINAQKTVEEAMESTLKVVEESGSALINALVEAKVELQEAAENFSSKDLITQTKLGIGQAVVASVEEVGKQADRVGVFGVIDGLVHSIAGIPNKINSFLEAAMQEVTANFKETALQESKETPEQEIEATEDKEDSNSEEDVTMQEEKTEQETI